MATYKASRNLDIMKGAIFVTTTPVNSEGAPTSDDPPFGWEACVLYRGPLGETGSSRVPKTASCPYFDTEQLAAQAGKTYAKDRIRPEETMGEWELETAEHDLRPRIYGGEQLKLTLSGAERDLLRRAVLRVEHRHKSDKTGLNASNVPDRQHVQRLPKSSQDGEGHEIPVVRPINVWAAFIEDLVEAASQEPDPGKQAILALSSKLKTMLSNPDNYRPDRD